MSAFEWIGTLIGCLVFALVIFLIGRSIYYKLTDD